MEAGGDGFLTEAVVELVRGCNLSCHHCLIPRPERIAGGLMSLDLALRAIERIHDWGAYTLTLTGGEPLLHKELGRIVVEGRERFMRVIINTNLTLPLDDRTLKLIAESGVLVKFSVYGLDYSDFRRVTGGSERQWNTFLKNIERLLAEGTFLFAMFVSTSNNDLSRISEVRPFSDLLDKARTGYIAKFLPDWYGAPKSHYDGVPPPVARGSVDDLVIDYLPGPKDNCALNVAPQIFIDHEGVVHPCPFLMEPVGHVLELNLDALFEKIFRNYLPWEGGRCGALGSILPHYACPLSEG